MWKIGLIINPVAGLGGRVGLKGSDGAEIQRQALALGARPESLSRTRCTLELLQGKTDELLFLTAPGIMGEELLCELGYPHQVVGALAGGATTAADTMAAAAEIQRLGGDLLLFAGGDGTARNICQAVGTKLPVIGIPAGVKIHSAVYALNPQNAGKAVLAFCGGKSPRLEEAEVMDIDEDAFREGQVHARLYGYMRTPALHQYLQGRKSGGYSDKNAMLAVAAEITDSMKPGACYFVGPGTTPRAVMEHLGLPNTLLGVDIIRDRRLVKSDATETDLYAAASEHEAYLILTVIGGQGHLFGRGNQQLSPRVLRHVPKDHIIILATREKLTHLPTGCLVVDTGDAEMDRTLEGYVRIHTGCQEMMMYRIGTVDSAVD